MIKVKVPATSANIGSGFDTLGLALTLYNTFECELSKETKIIGCEEAFNNSNNLFLQSFRAVGKKLGREEGCIVTFKTSIPSTRGLGSSASLLVGGAVCANLLYGNILAMDDLFQIGCEFEGHPDNVAPSLYGGLCASTSGEKWETSILLKQTSLNFTLLIPDNEVSTHQAREILPSTILLKQAAENVGNVLTLVEGFREGDMHKISLGVRDHLHEPYRKKLIPNYEQCKKIVEAHGGVMVISGSGSTCMAISNQNNFSRVIEKDILNAFPSIQLIDCKMAEKGVETEGLV